MNKLNDKLVEIYQQMLNSASPQQDFQHLPKELTAI